MPSLSNKTTATSLKSAPDTLNAQDSTSTPDTAAREVHNALLALAERSGAPFSVLKHTPARTIDDARASLDIDVTRIVKTIAFAARPARTVPTTDDDRLVLAALRGTRRVDYAKLAGLLGMSRRDLRPLAPGEVLDRLGVAPGGVSPLLPAAMELTGALVLMDEDALTITPATYSGLARPDRTLVMAATDLTRLSGARVGAFSKSSA